MSEVTTISGGGVTGYVQPNGRQTGGDGTTTWTVQTDAGQGETLLAYWETQATTNNASLGGYYQPDKSRVASGFFDTVTLVFSSTFSVGTAGSGDKIKTTYTPGSAMIEKPLEDHPSYKTCWNYNLFAWEGLDGSGPGVSPAWALTSTTIEDANGRDYKWAKDQPASDPEKGSWKCILPRTKRAEVYIYPQTLVFKREYFKTEAGAEGALRKRGVRETPGRFSNMAAEWLVTDCKISREGKYFVCETEYSGADKWDHDIYPAAGA